MGFHQDPKPSKKKPTKKLPEGKLNIIRRFESPKIRDTANAELNKMMTKLSSVTFLDDCGWKINTQKPTDMSFLRAVLYQQILYIQKRRVSSLKNINMLMKSCRSWDGTESYWLYMNGYCKKGKVQESKNQTLQIRFKNHGFPTCCCDRWFRKNSMVDVTHTNLDQSKQHHCWTDCSWNARNLPVTLCRVLYRGLENFRFKPCFTDMVEVHRCFTKVQSKLVPLKSARNDIMQRKQAQTSPGCEVPQSSDFLKLPRWQCVFSSPNLVAHDFMPFHFNGYRVIPI